MASSGYIAEETDFESIWGATIATARFDLINVRLGEILNYLLTGDAATDITDTKVLPILKQLSEEALMNILQAAKSNKFNDVWQFMGMNATRIMSKVLWDNRLIMKRVQVTLGKRYNIKYSSKLRLPSHSD